MARMEPYETAWQMVVESGDKRYACYGAEPYADASKTIEDHERRGNRDEPQQVETRRVNADRFHHRRSNRERPRHGASRVANLSTHERRGRGAGPCERYRRPKNHVGEAETRNDRLSSDWGRRAEAPPDREPEADEQDRLQPTRDRARAVEPFRARQPAHESATATPRAAI